jgi:high-affinity K+ transport system ATPase subunit B
MKDNKSASLFQKEQVIDSIKQSFVKLNPRVMIKNPIMFTVEVCTAIMFLVMLYSILSSGLASAMKSSTPAFSAIYLAVNGLSPVTMTVFTPILRKRSKRS